jgi:hypothetical protein
MSTNVNDGVITICVPSVEESLRLLDSIEGHVDELRRYRAKPWEEYRHLVVARLGLQRVFQLIVNRVNAVNRCVSGCGGLGAGDDAFVMASNLGDLRILRKQLAAEIGNSLLRMRCKLRAADSGELDSEICVFYDSVESTVRWLDEFVPAVREHLRWFSLVAKG